MPRRRGELEEAVARFFHTRARGFIVVAERGTATGLRRIPRERVARVTSSHIVLDDGTVIPLHRVVALEDEAGRTIWRRYRRAKRD
ncbi:hypothetical protein CF15_01070 [Pyrodictium occultum]|uniref:MJ1316 RNA cyclic group end recognition domain-containing protein n=1 Tax=Pyrodictium occultum TaxID=2309 RepID=A0A0V8RTT3_PYROC|nr:RNA repair domain-containing protein [Pyrodictium occultum]KSW11473.1 hypothetical protein CF15_01070 [Pyrodictium occultum]